MQPGSFLWKIVQIWLSSPYWLFVPENAQNMFVLPSCSLDCPSQNLCNFSSQPSQTLQIVIVDSECLSPSLSDSCAIFISSFPEPSSRITTLLPLPITRIWMIMCHGRLGGFGFNLVSSWVTTGIGTPTNMSKRRMVWTKGAHADGQVQQQTNKRSMWRGRTWRTCTFANKWTYQSFQHESKEQHARASSSELRSIKDSVHFAMQRWSYDTPWRHPSLSSTVARHALQQQHECTNIVLSSHVESSHESCCPHLH